MNVVRRLYNVAYGKVRLWQTREDPLPPELDEPVVVPSTREVREPDEPPREAVVTEPRQRRL